MIGLALILLLAGEQQIPRAFIPPPPARRLEPPKGGKWQRFIATGYSHGCTNPTDRPEPKYPQATASGLEAEANWSVAASPEDFPFLTVLEISFDGIITRRIVHDRGRDITKGRIDLFFSTCDRARQWGNKVVWLREVRRPLGGN